MRLWKIIGRDLIERSPLQSGNSIIDCMLGNCFTTKNRQIPGKKEEPTDEDDAAWNSDWLVNEILDAATPSMGAESSTSTLGALPYRDVEGGAMDTSDTSNPQDDELVGNGRHVTKRRYEEDIVAPPRRVRARRVADDLQEDTTGVAEEDEQSTKTRGEAEEFDRLLDEDMDINLALQHSMSDQRMSKREQKAPERN